MGLKIGENIRRLRRAKNMTQERLAEILNVSSAAVSKWESSDTYPDITIIMPLAGVFGISVDELMGYDAARIESEIGKILDECSRLRRAGKYGEATELIIRARKSYPGDYRIMSEYMWDLAGGSADNDREALVGRRDEFLGICDSLLEGCTDEGLRLETMTMKAKLLHAGGETGAALEILAKFPSWYQSAGQKTEQLFAKDTAEFKYWVRRNLYELADFAANKMIKTIWYDDGIPVEERVSRCEADCGELTGLRVRSDEAVFAVMERAALAEFAGKLTFFGGSDGDIIRIRGKSLEAARAISEKAEGDEVLREHLAGIFGGESPMKWTVNWLRTAPQAPLARLRENAEYMAMLAKYDSPDG